MRITLFALQLAACAGASEHGDDHGATQHGHDHGASSHGHGEHAAHGDEGPTVAITRWTDGHELFIELDAPVAGHGFAYHAHVTRLADNAAATTGTLELRFIQQGTVARAHVDDAVARPGIFSETARAPSSSGTYALEVVFEGDGHRATWDAGEIEVGRGHPIEQGGEVEGEIPFLKETQWQVPFRVAAATLRPMAPVLTASGVVRPDPAQSAVVAAPVDGLVSWSGGLPIVGARVRAGDRLGTLVPAGAAGSWASLSAELATARIDRDAARSELGRIEGLAEGELVSPQRLEQVRAAAARAQARVVAAGRRLRALDSGDAGAVSLRAPVDGLIVEVGAEHGRLARAGTPVVTVVADGGLIVDAAVTSRRLRELRPTASLVLTAAGEAPIDLLAAGGSVRTEQLVFDPDTLTAPLIADVPSGVGVSVGDLVEIALGVGPGEPAIAIPRSAVVEINGQDLVFVQRSGESFSRRRVQLGASDATHVAVLSGLSEGELVVVRGGFDVHVASLSGALESHRH